VPEGSVRKAGNRLRINVQLINTDTGYHQWSERSDSELDDVFAVQDEIARAVVRRLPGSLSGTARIAPAKLAISKAIADSPAPTLTGDSSSLHAVVSRALSKSQSQRYQAVTDLLAELGRDTTGAAPGRSDMPSIAVLPFADLSQEKDQDYFCDGLAEELIDSLARALST
jgi:TolB-like protein